MAPLAIFSIVREPFVQTIVAKVASAYISDKLQTEVTIGQVTMDIFLDVVIKDLGVKDRNDSTIISASRIMVNIDRLDLSSNIVDINSVSLKDAHVGLYKYKGESAMSFAFIVKSLSGEDQVRDTAKSPMGLNLTVDNFRLENCSFYLFNEYKEKKADKIDFSDLGVTDINLHIQNLKISPETDTIFFKMTNLSAREKSGLEIKKLKANFALSSKCILADHLKLITPNSELSMNLEFLYYDFSDFKDFLNNVKINTVIAKSDFNLADIGYFAPVLFKMDSTFEISGTFKGPVSSLYAENFKFNYGKDTRLVADIRLQGLPDVQETFVDLQIKELISDKTDIESFSLPVVEGHLALPAIINKLGHISVSGLFTGFYNNFTANASFKTDMGSFNTDISLSGHKKTDTVAYKGKIVGHKFNIGELLNLEEYLGTMDIDADINGSGLTAEKVDINMIGTIDSLYFLNNKFNKIKIHGDLSEKRFSGKLEVTDDAVNLDFDGKVDFEQETPVFDFYARLKDADLYGLNLIRRDSTLRLSTILNVNFQGLNLDEIEGNIKIDSTTYTEGNKTFHLENLVIVSLDDTSFKKKITLESDYIDADIQGDFMFTEIIPVVNLFVDNYIASLNLDERVENKDIPAQELLFNVKIDDYYLLSDLFTPGLKISNNTTIEGYFNSGNDSLYINAISDTVNYLGLTLNNFYLKNSNNRNNVLIETGSEKILFKEQSEGDSIELGIDRFALKSKIRNDSVLFNVSWDDTEPENQNKGDIEGFVSFLNLPRIETSITDATLTVNDTTWNISRENFFIFDTTFVSVSDFEIFSKTQSFKVNGKISETATDTFSVNFDDWNISNFDMIYASDKFDFDGMISGDIKLFNLYHSPKFIAGLDIKRVCFNKQLLGDANIETRWNNNDHSLYSDLTIINTGNIGKSKTLDINGYYYPNDEKLDFKGTLQNFNLKAIDPVVSGIFSNIEGLATGEFTLSGETTSPLLLGKIRLMRAGMVVDYLNVEYTFSHEITLEENAFRIDSLKIYDTHGNQGVINGEIVHNRFKDFKLDIDIRPQNLTCLNTNRDQNEAFYGKAYASGNVKILGPPGDLIMDIRAATNRGTDVTIPISGQMDVIEKDYIIFVNTDDTIKKTKDYNVNLSGLDLDLELSVYPSTNIQIFLPSDMGEIKANGTGNLKLNINQRGEFNLLGDYRINTGTFLFTLRNLLSKRFDIMEGGKITWTGNPEDADINLRALYKVKTSLEGLGIVLDTTSSFGNRVNVNCIIELRNKLLDPDIRFSIQLPDADEETEQLVYAALDTTDEAQMNQQMISLLVLGSFSYHTTAFNATAASYKLISNQLSNWLSQISNDFDIGVNYRPGDDISEEELEVALSTQLFNNRVLIDGNFGVINDQNSSNASNIVGDVNIEVKLTEDGRYRVRAFNRSNYNSVYDINSFDDIAPYTQGVGIFYRKEFNKLGELFQRKKKKKSKPITDLN